jgi:hypothetical protein
LKEWQKNIQKGKKNILKGKILFAEGKIKIQSLFVKLNDRNAIRILELNDFPKEVTEEARQIAEGKEA